MSKLIQINNYFFEVSKLTINPNKIGSSRRSISGKIHTDYTGTEYKTFELIIDSLNPTRHGQLLYLLNLCHPTDGGVPQNLTLVDDTGQSYTVTIPLPDGFDYDREEGKGEYYTWNLTLEEVV